ncbi:hypothetical protein CHU98_g4280 [Xylaria longipes]|nr:hypothetical protein CHU98_g4280 [Xylaria longipes]
MHSGALKDGKGVGRSPKVCPPKSPNNSWRISARPSSSPPYPRRLGADVMAFRGGGSLSRGAWLRYIGKASAGQGAVDKGQRTKAAATCPNGYAVCCKALDPYPSGQGKLHNAILQYTRSWSSGNEVSVYSSRGLVRSAMGPGVGNFAAGCVQINNGNGNQTKLGRETRSRLGDSMQR